MFDPLWLLTRQWQVGEFQGEDAGTPVLARVRATDGDCCRAATSASCRPNTRTQAPAYDPQRMPLEVMVERQRVRAGDARATRACCGCSVEAGLHFLRMLEMQPLSRELPRRPSSPAFALQPLSAAQLEAADEQTVRFVQTMAGERRTARRLEAIRTDGRERRSPSTRR